MRQIRFILAIVALSFSTLSYSASIVTTADEFNSPFSTSFQNWDLDDFNFNLNGETIVSASLSGTWGITSQFVGSSARGELYVDGFKVNDTDDLAVDVFNNVVNWSYTFLDFSLLQDGFLDFTAIQTSLSRIRLSETTLRIETVAPVPVPGAVWLMASGLVGLMGFSRKNKAQAVAA